jgi:hypothetical protein
MKLPVGACSNNFDFNAAVFGTTSVSFVVSNGLFLALAFCIYAVSLNAFGHQVSFDGVSALN